MGLNLMNRSQEQRHKANAPAGTTPRQGPRPPAANCPPLAGVPVDYVSFADTANRARYIVWHWGDRLGGSLLDVGCRERRLAGMLPGARYTGVDVAGSPDLRVDLDEPGGLPFDDDAFDCVVCADVLEHLERLHEVFDDLVRVARRCVLVSLPNCWAAARVPVGRGRGRLKQYGLPAEPPADRHRWFFNLAEARAFVWQRSSRWSDLTVSEERICGKPRMLLTRLVRRVRYPVRLCYLHRYAHTYWALLTKRGERAQ